MFNCFPFFTILWGLKFNINTSDYSYDNLGNITEIRQKGELIN